MLKNTRNKKATQQVLLGGMSQKADSHQVQFFTLQSAQSSQGTKIAAPSSS